MNLQAFQDELDAMRKEAATAEKKADEEARGLAGMAIAASGFVGGVGMLGLREALGTSLDKQKSQALGSVDDLAAKMGIPPPLRARDTRFAYMEPKQFEKYMREHKIPLTKEQIIRARTSGVVLGPLRGPAGSVAHETGHAVNVAKNKILTALANTSRNLGWAGSAVGAVAGGLMAVAPEDAESLAVKAAPIVPVLVHAPLLAEEALASVRALKGMKAVGYSPKVLKKAKGNLVKAFGTYLLEAAAVAAPIAAVSAARVWGAKKGKKKEAGITRVIPSLFAHAYKEDEDFRKTVKRTLSTDPNTRRNWQR